MYFTEGDLDGGFLDSTAAVHGQQAGGVGRLELVRLYPVEQCPLLE